MRDSSQYRDLAEWLHLRTSSFFNAFPWVSSLTEGQRACHRVSQQLNVDCHNAYMAGIIQKLGQQENYRFQHQPYHRVVNELARDSENRKSNSDIPKGIILRRLTSANTGDDSAKPQGKLANEIKGTLFFKDSTSMENACVGSAKVYDFYHPFYWEVPTVEEILKVFTFCKQGTIDKLTNIKGASL